MTIEGPLGLCTLLEGPLMSLTSFPSLIASNAVSMRLAIGLNATLYEYTKKDIYFKYFIVWIQKSIRPRCSPPRLPICLSRRF